MFPPPLRCLPEYYAISSGFDPGYFINGLCSRFHVLTALHVPEKAGHKCGTDDQTDNTAYTLHYLMLCNDPASYVMLLRY